MAEAGGERGRSPVDAPIHRFPKDQSNRSFLRGSRNEISGLLRQNVLRCAFIATHRKEFRLRTMLQVLEASKAGYYAWCKRVRSARVQRDAQLMREAGIKGKRRKRFRRTTNSKHKHPVAPNILARREQKGGLLGQCRCREFLCYAQIRVNRDENLEIARRSSRSYFRIHRSIVQSRAVAFQPGLR